MEHYSNIRSRLVFVIVSMVLVLSCSDSNNPLSSNQEPPTSLSASSKPTAVSMQMASTNNSNTETASSSDSEFQVSSQITLEEVKVLVKRLKLESTNEDSINFRTRNLVVDLPLDGSPFILTSEDIPSGSYDELKVQVHKPRGSQDVDDPDFTDGDARYSIVIRGTHQGEPFTFRSDENFNFEFEFMPPLQVTDSTTNVAIDLLVNIQSWFVDQETGQELDPTAEEDKERIEDNIKASFDAREESFKERDDDDDEEDEERRGREFEQAIVAVDVNANTFTLRGDIVVEITDSTVIRSEGDLFSLAEIESALNNNVKVEAEGRAEHNTTDPNIDLTARMVKFEREEDEDNDDDRNEFEGAVTSVNLPDSTFTLRGDVVVKINQNTTISSEGDLLTLEEVDAAVNSGTAVKAEGRAVGISSNSGIDHVARFVKFESEEDDDDDS